MGKNTLLVELEARDKGASAMLKNIKKESQELEKANKKLNDIYALQNNHYAVLQNKLSEYSRKIKDSQQAIKIHSESIKANKLEFKNLKEQLENNKQKLSDFQNKLKDSGAIKKFVGNISRLVLEGKRLSKELDIEKSKLSEMKERYNSLGQEITKLKIQKKELANAGKKNTDEYKNLSTTIKNLELDKKRLSLAINEQKKVVNDVNNSLKENKKAHKDVADVQKDVVKQENEIKKAISETEKAMNRNLESTKRHEKELKEAVVNKKLFIEQQKELERVYQKDVLKKQTDSLKKYADELQKGADKTKHFADGFNAVGNSLFKLSAPILAFSTYGVKAFVDFEDAFAGVRKTVDASEEQFEKLKNTVIEMSERLPQSATEISKTMEMAGQLGIGVDNIEEFTEVMIKLGDSTNLASDEAAKLLAQFSNITGMDTKDIERLGSVIVDLGNNSATTEADIVSMMSALAGAGKVFGLKEHQIAAISATISSLGIESEKGGTAMTKFLIKMAGAGGKATEEFKKLAEATGMTEKEIKKAMSESSQALKNFADVTGMTTDEFRKLAKENPSEAIYKVMESLDGMQKSGKDVVPILEALDIKEVRLRDTVLKLASGHKELRKNLDLSSKAWNENTALEVEAQKRYETTASKLKILKNQFTNVAMEIGVELLPTLLGLMEKAKDFLAWLRNMDSGTKQMLINFTKLTLGVATFSKGIGKLLSLKSGIMSFWAVLQKNKAENLLKTGKNIATVTGKVSDMAKSGASASGLLSKLGVVLGGLNPVTVGLTATVGALAVGFMAHNTHLKQMNETILDTTDKMSTWDKVVAWAYGTTKKSNKELEEMGLKFSDLSNLTPAFAESVKKARKEVADFNIKLEEVNLDGIFTLEESQTVDKQVERMVKNTIEILENNKIEIQEKFKEAFSKDGILSENEKKTLEYLAKDKNININSVKNMQNEIKRIQELAIKEKRELNEQEIRLIEEKVKKIKEIELQERAKSQEDLLYMQKKFVNEIGKLDLDGASNLMQEKRKIYDQEIIDIQSMYDAKIEILKREGEHLEGQKKIENENAIRTLEEQRQKELNIANNKYDDILKLVKEKYPEIAKEIDEWTGKILTDGEKKSRKELENYKKRFNLIEGTTHKGWQYVYDETSRMNKLVYVNVDETTNKITGIYDTMGKKVYSVNDKVKKDMSGLSDKFMEWKNTASGVLSNNIMKLGEFGKVNRSVMEKCRKELGFTEDATGALNGKITDLNGNPINIKIEKDGTIRNLKEIQGELGKIHDKTVYVNVVSNASSKGLHHSSYGNGYTGWASGTPYLKSYASGIKSLPRFNSGGYVTSRVNELGFELFDLPRRTSAFYLGSKRGEDIMNLPVGTEITNHIASTRKMIEAVKREVKKQVSPLYRMQGLRANVGDKVIKQEVTVKFENVVINDPRDIREIMEQMKYELKKEVM